MVAIPSMIILYDGVIEESSSPTLDLIIPVLYQSLLSLLSRELTILGGL